MWNEKGYKKSFRWPEAVRLPIAISVHHQSEEATCPMPDGQPDPFDYSERQYGARRGAWRLLDIMSRHGVRGTWLICGATLEKYPERLARRAASRTLYRRPHVRARDDVQYAAGDGSCADQKNRRRF